MYVEKIRFIRDRRLESPSRRKRGFAVVMPASRVVKHMMYMNLGFFVGALDFSYDEATEVMDNFRRLADDLHELSQGVEIKLMCPVFGREGMNRMKGELRKTLHEHQIDLEARTGTAVVWRAIGQAIERKEIYGDPL